MSDGPLKDIRVIEMAAIGPVPFCGMMLSDMGAQVIRIDRLDREGGGGAADVLGRGRRSLAMDLKKPEAAAAALRLAERADALLEGFRPGVMERLGLGPEECLARNPRLVYGRMTGWGQAGPLAGAAGHDINYISLAGALGAMGHADRPPAPPLNLVGDFGGGAMYLLAGVLAALLERHGSGRGQVVDAAMTDGAASLLAPFHGMMAAGMWSARRFSNRLDGGAFYYGAYECRDGKYVSVGALEPRFYELLLEKAGIDDPAFRERLDPAAWPEQRERLAAVFRRRTRREWCDLLEGTDACFAPVLDLAEAPDHPHNRARGTFVEFEGVTQPAPAPRFGRTPGRIRRRAARAGEHTDEVLAEWGHGPAEIAALRAAGAI